MKYKLIKWYPSLPKDWKTGTIVGEQTGGRRGIYPYGNLNKALTNQWLREEEVKNNPKFWEKVEEKDYEILSYRGFSTNYLYLKNSDGTYRCEKDPFVKANPTELNTGKTYKIHSVKRLSDGEVFTVGDRITYINGKSLRTIRGFNIGKDQKSIYIKANFSTGIVTYHINHVEKAEEPLFVTEDGVEIFEGDEYWYVNKSYDYYMTNSKTHSFSGKDHRCIYFSTKEKAKQWIDLHKPRYSKKNIIDMLNRCHHVDYMFDDLEYLYIKRSNLIKQLWPSLS